VNLYLTVRLEPQIHGRQRQDLGYPIRNVGRRCDLHKQVPATLTYGNQIGRSEKVDSPLCERIPVLHYLHGPAFLSQ
jgi:hypothetical protein